MATEAGVTKDPRIQELIESREERARFLRRFATVSDDHDDRLLAVALIEELSARNESASRALRVPKRVDGNDEKAEAVC